MKAIIVGGGIGGLLSALRLHHVGIASEVYEQSDQLRELGVGVNVLPHAIKELAEVGLLDNLADAGLRPKELIYAHRLGHEIMRRPCGLDAGFAYPQFSVHRGRLQGVLLRAVRERLGDDAVRTGTKLESFEQDADTVRARFVDRDGDAVATATGDVLIGADGIHSTTRTLLLGDEGPPRWNGVTMWRGATDWPAFGSGRSVIIAGGTSAKLVVYPVGPGQTPDTMLTNWAVCVRTGQDGDPPPIRQEWSRPADRAELRANLDRFHLPQLDHAGLAMATEDVYEFPMCDRSPAPFWSRGRVTLLGDAAHPMYPMGSNGAGQAILDTASLAGHLAGHASPADALLAYERDRLPATAELVLRNRKGGPEGVIDLVESRAPDGFDDLREVVDPAELDAIVNGYAVASGAASVKRG